MKPQEIIRLIDAVPIPQGSTLTQLKHEEDDELYCVWMIQAGDTRYILKETTCCEKEIYSSVLAASLPCVPLIHQIITDGETVYLLMEYIDGEDLCICDRTKLTLALDALISLQQNTWEIKASILPGHSFEKSLSQREDRGKYLNDPLLEKAYEKFLSVYRSLPRTLCHDDLLPFNVICGKEKAVLIDWEYGGFLPYPTSFARLIAHTEEDADALFRMTEEDKRFAIKYYYDRLLKEKGITYEVWLDTLDCFLFYEYCEWVFVGNKYNATEGKYFRKYLPMAKQQATKLMSKIQVRPAPNT